MQKTTNISPDKSRPIQTANKIKFDLNPMNYQCFISNSEKLHDSADGAIPHEAQDTPESSFPYQRRSSQISELRIPYIRRNGQGNVSIYSPQFNTQVLLM